MFYVTYVTVDGHSSTIHAEFKAAQTIFNQFAQAEGYPYVQWGGLGSGLIDESFRPHTSTFGTPCEYPFIEKTAAENDVSNHYAVKTAIERGKVVDVTKTNDAPVG